MHGMYKFSTPPAKEGFLITQALSTTPDGY